MKPETLQFSNGAIPWAREVAVSSPFVTGASIAARVLGQAFVPTIHGLPIPPE